MRKIKIKIKVEIKKNYPNKEDPKMAWRSRGDRVGGRRFLHQSLCLSGDSGGGKVGGTLSHLTPGSGSRSRRRSWRILWRVYRTSPITCPRRGV